MIADILDLLFPTTCLGCSTTLMGGKVACDRCERHIPLHLTLWCPVCGGAEHAQRCHMTPYRFGAAAAYETQLAQKLVHALKFEHVATAAQPLATILVRYIESVRPALSPYLLDPLVVPIPLHSHREQMRGYNQSARIAELFAHALGLSFHAHALLRTRATSPQHELPRAERLRNVLDCFAAPDPSRVAGRDVILIDDVATSGATLRDGARALAHAGARHILALAVLNA